MKKVMTIIVLVGSVIVTSTVYGFRPPNYYELSPEQKIEVLIETGYSDYDLNKIGKSTALPILHSSLSKYINDYDKAETIVGMISYFHDESSIDPLMQAWSINQKLEKDIVDAMTSIYERNNNSDKAYQAMIKLIKAPRYEYDEISTVDDKLFFYLVRVADKTKVPYLFGFLNDQSMPKPWEIIEKLGEIGDPSVVVPVIAEFLKHPFPDRRITASQTLGNIGSSLAIPYLIDAVKVEKDLKIKMNMAAQLVKLGEFLYLDEILKILEDPQWSNFSDIKDSAFSWLKEATGQDFGSDVTTWRKWFEDEKARRGLT